MTALLNKSWRDLSRHKARTLFTTLTVALGVMGIGLFAIMPLADQAVVEELAAENMHNVGIQVSDVHLVPDQIDALAALPNVEAMETRSLISVEVGTGDEAIDALLVGVPDFDAQEVDIVRVTSGEAPRARQVLTDQGNESNDVLALTAGDTVTLRAPAGDSYDLAVSGVGKSFIAGSATRAGVAVFYADIETLWEMTGRTGYTQLVFDLENTDRDQIDATVEDIRAYLVSETSIVAFDELADVREEGHWGGREVFATFMSIIMMLAVLILFVSVFLISNTMNTMVSEQSREIAMMKAIGATRGTVFRSFLTTSGIIGVAGSGIGAALGVVVAFAVESTFFRQGFGFSPVFAIHWATVALSIAVGIGVVLLASLPALLRTVRTSVVEGLESHGISSDYGQGFLDRALMGVRGLPRITQMGIRNALRRKGRSVSTILQVAFAVGVVLSMLILGSVIIEATVDVHDRRTFDVWLTVDSDPDHRVTSGHADLARGVDGVAEAEPFIWTHADVNERTVPVYGLVHNARSNDFDATLLDFGQGRLWTAQEASDAARVIVIGEALARYEGIELGDTVEFMTATGTHAFEVIGIDPTFYENGQLVWAPLEALQDALRMDDAVTGFFLHASTDTHSQIDRIAQDAVDAYEEAGFRPDAQLHYEMAEQNVEQNEALSNLFLMISFIVVLIVLVGLMNTLVMNILDRTTEIGMLRCIGARSRDIKRVFSAEGLLLALVGWIAGIPIGYALSRLLAVIASDAMKLTLPDVFPLVFVGWSFVFTIVGTVIVIYFPLRRAAKMRPGDALRYE